MKFKVLAGKFYPNAGQQKRLGKPVEAGTIVESDRPLDEMFKGKFEKLDDVRTSPAVKATPSAPVQPDVDEPEADEGPDQEKPVASRRRRK